MHDVAGGSQESEPAGNTSNSVNPAPALQSIKQPELKAPEPAKDEGAANPKKRNLIERIWQWCVLKEEKTGLHDWFIVVFTFVLTVVAVFQGIIVFQNSKSSTVQMVRVIDAANRINDAADSFSTSSANISRGIIDAVEQLGAQAKATKDQLDAFRKATDNASQTQILIGLPVIVFPGNNLIIENAPDGSKILATQQIWLNVGGTRAVGPKIRWGWGRERPSARTHYQFEPRTWERSNWAPNVTNADKEVLSNLQIKEVSETKPLFVYGRVRYDDIYPVTASHKRKDHLIEYCIRMVEVSMKMPDYANWGGQDLPEGYCYDEKCPDY